MKVVKRVTLELLRGGRRHNQLISSLTPYLAVCGDHEPQTMYLPFDHHEYLLEHEALRRGGEGASADQETSADAVLFELGRRLGQELGRIPGLLVESGRGTKTGGVLHLDLVFSANELSLLPFEAMIGADGMPGGGRPLALQLDQPVAITRRRRHISAPPLLPDMTPLVLIAISDAGGDVPGGEHAEIIKGILGDWGDPQSKTLGEPVPDVIVIQQASLGKIRSICAARPVTHVHIVARAGARAVLGGIRFGIELHEDDGVGSRLILGSELAGALRPHAEDTGGIRAPISAVVLAFGEVTQESTVPPGGSFAQELHDEGIPLVLTSQFPLSKRGAAAVTREWYSRLLRGEDPAVIAHGMRQRLRVEGASRDWGSLVVYHGLREHDHRNLLLHRIIQARRLAVATLRRLRSAAEDPSKPWSETDVKRVDDVLDWLVKAAPERGEAREWLSTETHLRAARAELFGMRGSIFKLLGEVARARGKDDRQREHFEQARAAYLAAADDAPMGSVFKDWGKLHWVATQYILMVILLGGNPDERWFRKAEASCAADLESSPIEDHAWIHADAAELSLLSLLAGRARQGEEEWSDKALREAGELATVAPSGDRRRYLATRQLRRYVGWLREDGLLPTHPKRRQASDLVAEMVRAVE